ncbi:sensor histidine kinase [Paenibacillus sp. Leaf72]|uniref:sensor histidine kinase n=1 Tax=Paenibacillus sp. Leaf72 TaxID=1736234 RepID=UPI0006FD40D8|nr:sensor histidine kinase [Paenibacillus sp. Leaf72]KQO10802.1 histidine kinase [Paenibacillus sp. Leaf72]
MMKAIAGKVWELLSFWRELVARRLVNKLILLFTGVIVLVVASLNFISYQMLEKESVGNSIDSTTNNLLLVGRNLEDYLKGIEQISLPQIGYDEITYAIMHESEDYSSKMYVENYLRNLFYSRSDLEAIYLYVVEKQKYYAITRENYNITVRTGTNTIIAEQPWYAKAMADPSNQAYQSLSGPDVEADSGYSAEIQRASFMAYHRVLRSIKTRKPQAMLSFYYNASVKDEIVKDIPFSEGQHLLYVSPDNEPFELDDEAFYTELQGAGVLQKLGGGAGLAGPSGQAGQNKQAEQAGASSGPFTWVQGEQKYLIIYNVAEKSGWKLIKPIPYSQIYEAATKTRNLNYAIGVLFLLLAVILVSLMSSAITKPLKKLSRQMSRFSAGSFDAEAEVKGRDEIAYLSRHFNLMVRRTNELINERYKMKLAENHAILKALEAEINPHFLYNALQAISTKALKHQTYDVADMIDALALTFRYCISGKDIVFAREELKHIERYMALQTARFGARLQVVYEWEEALMELEIPKLSVQTLVENAIKHGLEKVTSTVTIGIKACLQEDGTALISVQDDGPGFTQERLGQVEASLRREWGQRESDNIGLVNLYTRLKLLYGEEAQLLIKSDHAGTELAMRLPRRGGNGS